MRTESKQGEGVRWREENAVDEEEGK